MSISVVLRLAERALRAGRLAGEAEVVETGERAVVRDADELVQFLRRADVTSRGSAPGECGDFDLGGS